MRSRRRETTKGTRGRPQALILAGWAVVLCLVAQTPAGGTTPATSHAGLKGAAVSPTIGVVGDMACDASDPHFKSGAGTSTACTERAVSSLMLADTSLTAVLGLGDFQYACGDPTDYAVSYDPTWGRLDPLMRPVPGNHEYQTGKDAFGGTCPTSNTSAQSFFNHFGAAAHPATRGHFSFDLGSWHLIGLNANCGQSGVGGCGATGPQTIWLEQDLASTTQPCIAAFWHQPLFTGDDIDGSAYRAWWKVLYAAHVDVVLNGHVHDYQRYPPLDPTGAPDPAHGITEYVVGTGGENLMPFVPTVTPPPVTHLQRFGYLRMTLDPTGWTSEFIDSTGVVADTSSGTCHA